jgi:anti-anti-sigma regulatory factor
MSKSNNRFSIVKPDFPLDLKNILKIKTFFNSFFLGKENASNVLLDLSAVKSIDSVGFKSIHNLYSSLQKKQVGLLVYTEQKDVADQFRKIVPDIKLTDKIESGVGEHWLDVQLECPVCHNTNFPQGIINRAALKLVWKENSYLPSAVNAVTGEEVDIYREGLIVCNDCLLTSFYHTDYKQIDGNVEIPPVYSSDAKTLLIKSTNRRRDMLARIGVEQSDYPAFMRNRENVEYLYRLCADCIASTSFDRTINRFFEAGIANFLVYHFMPENKKEKEFLERADVNFKDCIRFRPPEDLAKVWQAHYYRLVIAVLEGRQPQLLSIVDAFRKERNELQDDVSIESFDLWFKQAQRIHKQAINDVASKYTV